MFYSNRFAARRFAVSAAGALLFSGLCIGGAVAPAQAAAPATPLAAWQADATGRLDAAMAAVHANARRFARTDATIRAAIAADGTLSVPHIVRSSGSRTADAALLARAARLRLAPLPADITSHDVLLKVALVEGTDAAPSAATAIRYAAR